MTVYKWENKKTFIERIKGIDKKYKTKDFDEYLKKNMNSQFKILHYLSIIEKSKEMFRLVKLAIYSVKYIGDNKIRYPVGVFTQKKYVLKIQRELEKLKVFYGIEVLKKVIFVEEFYRIKFEDLEKIYNIIELEKSSLYQALNKYKNCHYEKRELKKIKAMVSNFIWWTISNKQKAFVWIATLKI